MRLSNINKVELKNATKKFKIIGVDDEAGVLKTLKVVLEKVGYDFEGYTNHWEALEKMKTSQYDLLILDYLLDQINGSQVVELVRQFDKELYILLLTGHSETAPALETLEKNDIQGYCTKSNDPGQLMLLVRSAYKAVSMLNEIRMTRNGMNHILEAVPKIYQLRPIDVILELILNHLLQIIEATNAFIFVDNMIGNEDIGKKGFFKGIGKFNTDIDSFISLFNPSLMEYAGQARMKREIVRSDEGVFFPLLNDISVCMGVIYVEMQDHKSINILEIFAIQAASSINNAFLHSLLNIKNDELFQTYEVIKNRYEETINTLRLTVDAKDAYTSGHSDRVSKYAVKIGECFDNVSQHELDLLRIGGVFHDIGKIGTADDILLTDKKLNELEYNEIKKHPQTGANILSALSMFNEIVPLVMYHHEKIDGSGYPRGLKGEEIPFLARILSIADAFDAMTTNRVYRHKLTFENTVNQLRKGAGSQFDSDIIDKFISLLKSESYQLNIS